MNAPALADPVRRDALKAAGTLVLWFALGPRALSQDAKAGGTAPGSLEKDPSLDSWIRIDATGAITVFTGKVELGQGLKTALVQLAAEELVVDPKVITLVTADTARTPNEGYTSGSHSMQDSGTAIVNAAAQVRVILVAGAAQKLGVEASACRVVDASVIAPDGRRIGYGEIVAGTSLHVNAQPVSERIDAKVRRVVGKPYPRVDIPAKVTGGAAYIQDMRLEGMVHGRIVWPPSYGATLKSVERAAVEKLPGVLAVVQDGSFLGVIAAKEFQAIEAMQVLAASARWDEKASLPASEEDLFEKLEKADAQLIKVRADPEGTLPPDAKIVEARYRRSYQMHGSIGTSCALAQYQDGELTVWTHAQGVYPLRGAIAGLLEIPPKKVRCIHVEGSGCYGHNGADDVAGDAALLARAFPGRPVRVQWMREHEHTWEPYGSATQTMVRAALAPDGRILSWDYRVRCNTHSTRPGPAGYLMAAWHQSHAIAPPAPKPIPLPEGGGDRNALPLYRLDNARVLHDFVPEMPLRVSALRSLGAYANIFSIESFLDELAHAAGADPVEFRLRILDDSRARDVVQTAADRFGWSRFARTEQHGRRSGKGFAFARYKNLGAYLAIAVEIDLDRESGQVRLRRAVAAVDSGEAVNPDGIRNQVEGGIVQSTSWSLLEAVQFDATRITSRDWNSYRILRFDELPDVVDVHVLDRPGQPFLGTGEASQGPTAAALANALYDACGKRLREVPMTAARVKKALEHS
jgi:CO/xanthine dehydrogenase Mo-binding subunit